jgi:replication factor C subunit 3/5
MDIPWVEKYRPKTFDEIVLNESNQLFFTNVMKSTHMPNMLFHGPPGTGKTTTILNIIRSYQHLNSKGLMLHLNASDERGIETIRTQIFAFVHAKPLFNAGTKFVILDEVDSMTKTAQQALCSMLQTYVHVRFCLICNYISRIDMSLQSMFIKIKFNNLPTQAVVDFLSTIVAAEALPYNQDHLHQLQQWLGSDLRSMVNYLQTNRAYVNPIITSDIWDTLFAFITASESLTSCVEQVYEISSTYNISLNHLMKDFMFHVWMHHYSNQSLSQELGIVFHNSNINADHMVRYLILLLNNNLKQ